MPARRKPTTRWPKWSGSTRRRLQALVKDHGVKLAAFPEDLVAAARKQATGVLGELASRSAITGQGARLLCRLPRGNRAVVANLHRGGVARARGLTPNPRFFAIFSRPENAPFRGAFHG